MKRSERSKLFTLARQMHLAGIKQKQIAEIVGKRPGTVKIWLKFETWESYCNSQKARAEKYRHPKAGFEVEVKEDNTLTEKSFQDMVIERLDKIEMYLSEKKVIW